MKKTNKIKVILVSAIAAGILASICATACAATSAIKQPSGNSTSQAQQEITGLPWAMQNCGYDIAKAEEISGLKYNIPEYSNYEIYAMPGLIEVNVMLDESNTLNLRQSSDKGDITGIFEDYTYKSINDARLSGLDAKFAVENGRVYAAYWSDGDCGYSLSCDNGMSIDDAVGYILK